MIVQPQPLANDEIDLVELFRALWRQRLLIVGVTFAVTLIAAAYAFLATPYYQTKTYLRPVPQSMLDQLNETGIYKLTPEDALSRVASGLSSYDKRLDYFLSNQEMFQAIEPKGDSAEQAFADFNEQAFEMLHPDPKKTENRSAYVGLKLTYPKGMEGSAIVNGFVDYVLELERKEIAEDLESLIANRLASLDMNMEAQRANYSASKEAKIATLLEDAALEARSTSRRTRSIARRAEDAQEQPYPRAERGDNHCRLPGHSYSNESVSHGCVGTFWYSGHPHRSDQSGSATLLPGYRSAYGGTRCVEESHVRRFC